MQRLSPYLDLAFWLLLALGAFVLSFSFSGETGTYEWGAASWPRAVILLMAITALINAWQARPAAGAFDAIGKEGDGEEDTTDREGSIRSSLGLFLIPLVYVLLLPRTGFYLTTPFFLLAYLFYVGERRWGVLLGATVVITTIANLIFTKLFFVALPVGNWPGFYDVNNWLLTVIR